MTDWWWSWALTIVGLVCFLLAGRKVWWAWYVGIAGQVLWLAYSLISQQWGFLVGVAAYTVVYVNNAIRWTRERERPKVGQAPPRMPRVGPKGPAGNSGAAKS